MPKIIKICLFVAIFLSSAGLVWSAFNYNSANNYFLIDTNFKSGGNYILVGNAFNETLKKEINTDPDSNSTQFFGISNNLIFLQNNANVGFCTIASPADNVCTGQRKIQNKLFSTSGITVKQKDLEIYPQQTGDLQINAPEIDLLKDFIVDKFTISPVNPTQYSINTPKLLANEIKKLTDTELVISTGIKITLNAGPVNSATAGSIVYTETGGGEKQFCKVITWTVTDNTKVDVTKRSTTWTGHQGDVTNTTLCSSQPGGGDLGVGDNPNHASKTCCPKNYFILDYDANAGKMVCCRFNELAPSN